jgi:hypothetical protein
MGIIKMITIKSAKMFQANYKKVLGFAVVVVSLFSACKKEQRPELYPASLTIANGIADNSSFVNVYFGDTRPKVYVRLAYVYSGGYFNYATNKTDQPIRMFRNNDTLSFEKPFAQTRLALEPGGIYTHFIYGSPGQVKQKTVKENLPSRSVSDSVLNLRIINLFENRPIDVVQLEPVAGPFVTNLAYEQLSDFIKVPANTAVKNFRFEIKDHATGATLTTFTQINMLPGVITPDVYWLFRARTMLVTGTWAGAGNFSIAAKTIGHF